MKYELQLQETVRNMMMPAKGIVALDESTTTAAKRLADVGLENNESNRQKYREIFINAPEMGKYVSGVILYDETIKQSDRVDVPFRDTLQKNNVMIGIKVDEGTEPVLESPKETLTKGLEGLAARLPEYVALGARFAKWRVAIPVGDDVPTEIIMQENANRMAVYAQLCQEHGIVPMVEPEVLMEGNHTQARAKDVVRMALTATIKALQEKGIWLPGVIVKTSMVVPGAESGETMDPKMVAADTIEVLQSVIPADIGGVVFLSGGQTTDQALHNLNAMAQREPLPFSIACSFARALQKPAMDVWQGKDENIAAAQQGFIDVLQKMSLADQGKLA